MVKSFMSAKLESNRKSAAEKIASISDIENLDAVLPRDLCCDKGTAFPRVLMSNLKRYKESCNVVHSLEKVHHRMSAFLSSHARFDATRLGIAKFED